jgi:hypothetical protein
MTEISYNPVLNFNEKIVSLDLCAVLFFWSQSVGFLPEPGPPIFVLQLDVVRFLAMDLDSWVWLLPAAYALIFPEASSFLVLHPHQWISLFPFCIPNRFSCSSDRAPSSARTSLESWFCRWDFFVRVLPRRFQLPFSVFPPESAGRIFFPLLLLLISLLATVPQFLRFPLFFFAAVLRSPGGVSPLSLLFSSAAWPVFGLVRSSCSPDCLVRSTAGSFFCFSFRRWRGPALFFIFRSLAGRLQFQVAARGFGSLCRSGSP